MSYRRTKYKGYQLHRMMRRFTLFCKQYLSLSMVVMWLLLLIWIFLFVSLRSKIYHPTYKIDTILFTSWSIATHDDPILYASIVDIYSGTYYTSMKWFRPKLYVTEAIQSIYPVVRDIQEIEFANNTLLLDISFQQPLLRIRYHDGDYALYPDYFVSLWWDDTLATSTPLVLLPIYLSGTSTSLSGILYGLSPYKLLTDYLLLKTAPIQWSLTYVPWWEKYILRNEQQRVYFNTRKDISTQLLKLILLYKHYPWFDNLKQIDVGSIADPIVR